ncbi:MAG: DUF2797 domain-containing protein [Flavobacterium nitrogenifigens]|uniref:DUF2797 domain-containing protein n=1 Tax=Flavobacterium nitrogenifigens TaxID=1617283 RepID=A0A521EZ42_9FLAO|nr:DUF2797 domain-containing protein [Flavobacterium nitrogenifigens]KAF2336089.1 DUF2797 domain-containing protein [Flavobacterium nitrogenifigens]MDQ8011758.1 DUF2797 domain-containing protein [Flavobacterium nitrogenifigens]SMO89147.1 Protein of unknown function [Flavobacterium nitrogenifigens]
MQYQGVLTKMQTELGSPIQYYLVFEDNFLNVNQLLDKEIEINFVGTQCLNCGKKKKIYRQGFCYECFYSSPAVGDWIMRPELSTAHLGIADRDLEYESKAQLQPHIVYLASASEIKVGVTRKAQIPTRWIDQGASQAIAIVEVPNRYLAGITEVALKDHYTDKTNWRKMLQNSVESFDLIAEKAKIESLIPQEVRDYFYAEKNDVYELQYPVLTYPAKVNSLNLDKTPSFSGKLTGIKGQYLLFENGTVFNVRGSEGYVVTIDV